MDYRYLLAITAEDGRLLEHVPIVPSWKAALAWAHFESIRAGHMEPLTSPGETRVEPVWDATAGEPTVGSFRITLGAADGSEVHRALPRTYLRRLAEEASATLVERGVLTVGQAFRWAVTAFPVSRAAEPPSDDFLVAELPQRLAVGEASLASFFGRSAFAGPEDEPDHHVPVFLPEHVLDQAMELARRAGDVETGGVLVGTLHRDVERPDVFVEVTAQIPAEHTAPASTKLTFSSDTWAAVQAAIALRRRDELMLGWWHYHPDFCRLRGCPPERRRVCTGASPFFSADDVHLHATCFPAGYHVALLISDGSRADGLTRSLFGWWQGRVVARGFHVLGGATHAPIAANAR